MADLRQRGLCGAGSAGRSDHLRSGDARVVIIVLLASAAIDSWLPAMRAARIDPVNTFRPVA